LAITVEPNTGFQTHPHQDMENVTGVLEGELEHKDTLGNVEVIYPGRAQRMSAGTGIWYLEMIATRGGDVHFFRCGRCRTPSRSLPATSGSISALSFSKAGWSRSPPAGGIMPRSPSASRGRCSGPGG